ncbi:hypothetical protein D3C81_1689580 [compost metagenome]
MHRTRTTTRLRLQLDPDHQVLALVGGVDQRVLAHQPAGCMYIDVGTCFEAQAAIGGQGQLEGDDLAGGGPVLQHFDFQGLRRTAYRYGGRDAQAVRGPAGRDQSGLVFQALAQHVEDPVMPAQWVDAGAPREGAAVHDGALGTRRL